MTLKLDFDGAQAEALRRHAIPALRDAAMKPCHRS